MKLVPLFTGSFHSAATYREVRRSGQFYMGYALFVVALCTFIITVYYTALVHREVFAAQQGREPLFDQVVKQVTAQMPVMTFKDGTLATRDARPTIIKISGQAFGETFTDVDFATVDTTGATTHENMKTPIVVTAKELLIKTDREIKIKQLSEFTKEGPQTILVNRAVAEDMGRQLIAGVHDNLIKFYVIIDIVVFVFLTMLSFVLRIFMLLLLGAIGLLIGSLTDRKISYASLVGLASLSYTPVALLDTALLVAFGYSPHLFTLALAGSVALFAAIKCSNDMASSHTPSPFA